MKKRAISQTITYFFLTIYAFICLYPFIWMVFTSLKSWEDAYRFPLNLLAQDGSFHFDTYSVVWNKLNFVKFFVNSFTVSIGVVIGVVIIYSLIGFGLAKINFKGNAFLKWMFLSLMLVPGVTIVIPLAVMINNLGLMDTYLGVVLPMINGGGPLAVLLFMNYFKTVPHELYESSVIDGLNKFSIYWRIYFPLALPAAATVAIMNFLGSWNSLLWPMIAITNNEGLKTLPLGLQQLLSTTDKGIPHINEIMAGSVISIIPILLIFLLMQKYYVEGLTAGAVKG